MHSKGLSLGEWQRLIEVCDEWAVWFTRRWGDRPALQTTSAHKLAPNSGRQYQEPYEINAAALRGTAERVDLSITAMGVDLPDERRVLHRWAWLNHYNRKVIRTVEEIEGGRRVVHTSVYSSPERGADAPMDAEPAIAVTEDSVTCAQLALVPYLPRYNVVLN